MVAIGSITANATLAISGAIAVFVFASLVCVEASRVLLRRMYSHRDRSHRVEVWAFGSWVRVFRKRAIVIGVIALAVALASWAIH